MIGIGYIEQLFQQLELKLKIRNEADQKKFTEIQLLKTKNKELIKILKYYDKNSGIHPWLEDKASQWLEENRGLGE